MAWHQVNIRELKLKDLYKDHQWKFMPKLKQSSKTEQNLQIPSEKYSKVVTQYLDRIYEDTGSVAGPEDKSPVIAASASTSRIAWRALVVLKVT